MFTRIALYQVWFDQKRDGFTLMALEPKLEKMMLTYIDDGNELKFSSAYMDGRRVRPGTIINQRNGLNRILYKKEYDTEYWMYFTENEKDAEVAEILLAEYKKRAEAAKRDIWRKAWEKAAKEAKERWGTCHVDE